MEKGCVLFCYPRSVTSESLLSLFFLSRSLLGSLTWFSPLGILHPGYAALTKYGKKMYIDLERNPEEYGFLGYSSYFGADTVTKPFLMQIMYFRSVEQ